ncbi:hypothetical protein KCP71_24760 [Salmonella enterica subsp. enterica]|nr:hypothetical protein KCP71_24760 [Salmonella enterica subsp. enterica]
MGIILKMARRAPPRRRKRFYRPLYLHRTAHIFLAPGERDKHTQSTPQILMFTPGIARLYRHKRMTQCRCLAPTFRSNFRWLIVRKR